MNARDVAGRLRERARGKVTTDAPLGPYTTFRVGGPAAVLVEAESEEDLVAVAELRDELPVAVVGRGSNLLVSDTGFEGIAVRLGREFRKHSVTEDGLRLGGAIYLPAAARLTAQLGRTGFEFAAEIPATFGGAVRMNAGAHDRSMADVLVHATVVDLSAGSRRRLDVSELGYGYRHSSLGPADVVTDGQVRLEPADPGDVAQRIRTYLDWRRATQPGGRSAGSVFKNPPGDSAGRLIDDAGAKGMREGEAEVSDAHANFIVAGPNARATDIWTLIQRVKRLVHERSGVELVPEVRFLGAFGSMDDTS